MDRLKAASGESIFDYTRRLADESRGTGRTISGEFNGTPIEASPDRDASYLYQRWYDDRLCDQHARFERRATDLRRELVGKKIVSVLGVYNIDGVDEFRLALDDGTEVVARGTLWSERKGRT